MKAQIEKYFSPWQVRSTLALARSTSFMKPFIAIPECMHSQPTHENNIFLELINSANNNVYDSES